MPGPVDDLVIPLGSELYGFLCGGEPYGAEDNMPGVEDICESGRDPGTAPSDLDDVSRTHAISFLPLYTGSFQVFERYFRAIRFADGPMRDHLDQIFVSDLYIGH